MNKPSGSHTLCVCILVQRDLCVKFDENKKKVRVVDF